MGWKPLAGRQAHWPVWERQPWSPRKWVHCIQLIRLHLCSRPQDSRVDGGGQLDGSPHWETDSIPQNYNPWMGYLRHPVDFPGTPQTPLKKIPTSEDLWDFSFILRKFGEWNSEAFFALQPEGCLFSFALWEAKESWWITEQESLPVKCGPSVDNSGRPYSLPENVVCSQNCNKAGAASVREKLHCRWNRGHILGLCWSA